MASFAFDLIVSLKENEAMLPTYSASNCDLFSEKVGERRKL